MLKDTSIWIGVYISFVFFVWTYFNFCVKISVWSLWRFIFIIARQWATFHSMQLVECFRFGVVKIFTLKMQKCRTWKIPRDHCDNAIIHPHIDYYFIDRNKWIQNWHEQITLDWEQVTRAVQLGTVLRTLRHHSLSQKHTKIQTTRETDTLVYTRTQICFHQLVSYATPCIIWFILLYFLVYFH